MKNFTIWILLGLRKLVLSTQSTPVHIMVTISCSVCTIQNLKDLLNRLWNAVYVIKFVSILSKHKKLFHFKLSKLGQILHVDKTGVLRPSHNN